MIVKVEKITFFYKNILSCQKYVLPLHRFSGTAQMSAVKDKAKRLFSSVGQST